MSSLLTEVTKSIVNHASIEDAHDPDSNDKILLGYL